MKYAEGRRSHHIRRYAGWETDASSADALFRWARRRGDMDTQLRLGAAFIARHPDPELLWKLWGAAWLADHPSQGDYAEEVSWWLHSPRREGLITHTCSEGDLNGMRARILSTLGTSPWYTKEELLPGVPTSCACRSRLLYWLLEWARLSGNRLLWVRAVLAHRHGFDYLSQTQWRRGPGTEGVPLAYSALALVGRALQREPLSIEAFGEQLRDLEVRPEYRERLWAPSEERLRRLVLNYGECAVDFRIPHIPLRLDDLHFDFFGRFVFPFVRRLMPSAIGPHLSRLFLTHLET